MEFRCILFWDTSESDIFVESRCIWNVWFLEHTSEMLDLRAFPMYYDTGFSRRYIGIKISMTIPMYGSPNQSNNTSGWANIDYFRCIAKYHHSEIHRNPAIHSHPDVSHLISREYTYISSQYIPARAGKTNKIHRNSKFSPNPDVSQLISRECTCLPSQHIPARAGKTNKIHRNSKFSPNPDVFILISRDSTRFPSQ